jgi:hypothetical protein
LLAQAVLGGIPLRLPMKVLPEILLFPIIISLIIFLVIPLIPLWTSAGFTGFTAIAATTAFDSLLCKEQSSWSEPILCVDCGFLFEKLGDDLIRRGGHCGVVVHHELQEDFPLIVPSDPTKEVQDVFLFCHLGDCLCRVRIGSIHVSCRSTCADIVILAFSINQQRIVIDITAVL